MFIQIHALQSFPPGNLNRDDRGLPKSALFGGVTRGRISSQCLKRRMRQSDAFAELQNGVAIRTRRLPALVGDVLRARAAAGLDEATIARIEARIASAFKKEAGTEAPEDAGDGVQTGQLVFFPRRFVESIADLVGEAFAKDRDGLHAWLAPGEAKGKATKGAAKTDGDKTGKKADREHPLDAAIRDASRLVTIDIAMFGRMTTSELVEDVEAACQVAHSISTHEVRIERDYFTTMDDLSTGSGAGFVGGGDQGTYFNSAVYYRYLNLDLRQLHRNVRIDGRANGGDMLSDKELADAASALLNAVVHAGPTAKQNTFAAHSVPEVLVCEISDRRQPISYANAFLEAVELDGEGSLMARSAERLRSYVSEVASRFEPAGLRRLVLAVGDGKGELEGAKHFERYSDFERAFRDQIIGVHAGSR